MIRTLANRVSYVLPWGAYPFVNPDLTVHLFRPLSGEWVGMASATHHSTAGIGMSDTAVFDIDGRIGRSSQTLLIEQYP